MSKKQHQKQVDRARAKRRASKYDRRAARNKVVIIVMAVLMGLSLVAGSLAVLLAGDEPEQPEIEDDPFADDALDEVAEGPCPTAEDQDVPEPTDEQYDEPPAFPVDDDVTYVAILHTTCGDIELALDTDNTPAAAQNFLGLAEDGFYAGVPFHRTVNGFMIQGGDPTGTGTGGPGYQFDAELETAEALEPMDLEELGFDVDELEDAQIEQFAALRSYPRGALAMANSNDPNTQGSQFFIVQGDPAPLEPLYTLFGEVVDGMDVVDDIAAGPAGGQQMDQALDPVYITSVTIETR